MEQTKGLVKSKEWVRSVILKVIREQCIDVKAGSIPLMARANFETFELSIDVHFFLRWELALAGGNRNPHEDDIKRLREIAFQELNRLYWSRVTVLPNREVVHIQFKQDECSDVINGIKLSF